MKIFNPIRWSLFIFVCAFFAGCSGGNNPTSPSGGNSTSTPTPLPPGTPTNTVTNTSTGTSTSTPIPTPTSTPVDTATNSATPTPTFSSTLTPTFTSSATASNTPTSTSTGTPTGTATDTATSTHTGTPTDTATPSFTATPTSTATDSATNTPTKSPTPTPRHSFITQWGSNTTFTGSQGSGWFRFDIGAPAPGSLPLFGGGGTAMDASGNIYVADTANNRIQVFSAPGRGNFTTMWSAINPFCVAVDSSNNVYVANYGSNRVEKYSSSGILLAQTSDPLSFHSGCCSRGAGLAVRPSDGRIYVADWGNNLIKIFNNDLTSFGQWGSGAGSGNGYLNNPIGIDFDASNNLYVADAGNNRIEVFDSTGAYSTQWGTLGTGDGQFDAPEGVAVDSTGNVYVADRNNSRIEKFSPTGSFLAKWANGSKFYVTAVSVSPSDEIYMSGAYFGGNGTSYSPYPTNGTIVRYDTSGGNSLEWDGSSTGNTFLADSDRLVVDASNNLFVTDRNNYRVLKYGSTGSYLGQWGGIGPQGGRFDDATCVAVDSSGNIYVADSGTYWIQKFDSSGVYVTQWGAGGGSGAGQFAPGVGPAGIAVDSSGYVYVGDPGGGRVQIFTNNGTFQNQVTGLSSFNGIAIDGPNGLLYVAEPYQILEFTTAGSAVTSWGAQGSGNGQFDQIMDLAVGPDSHVYVADKNNDRVQEFDSAGNFVMKWGTSGSGSGQFGFPSGIALDSLGNVYVADGWHRIQKFAP